MTAFHKPRVAVLGFGLVGRVAALMLADKYQIDIFERSAAAQNQSAGLLAAAMLAPLAESVICEQDLAEAGLASIAMWPALLEKLSQPVFFQQQGTMVIAHHQDRGDLQSFYQRLKPLSGYQAESINHSRIKALEPELNGFHQGLFLPCEGQLDNVAFYHASQNYLTQRSVRFHYDSQMTVQALQAEGFDWVIDCRGLGAKNGGLPLRGVRGEVARVFAPEVTLSRPVRLMHPRYPIYIAPKPDHHFVIGATEIESQDSGSITLRSTLELLSAAYTVHSGFAEGRILSLDAGLRPAFVDNRPKVDIKDNVISINGLYRHGYLLAPKVVHDALSQRLL